MASTFAVKELYRTLQGEGARAGRAAVFCRFAGCNLWSGREADRFDAVCRFCDTDFVGTDGPGGGRFPDAGALAAAIRACWDAGGDGDGDPYVVFTGGEPALQLDADLVGACHRAGLELAIETNGSLALPPGIDWVTVSPKDEADLVVTEGHELKLVHPQGGDPARFLGLAFRHFYLQPMDGPDRDAHTAAVVRYCLDHPRWRLSLQTQELLGIP